MYSHRLASLHSGPALIWTISILSLEGTPPTADWSNAHSDSSLYPTHCRVVGGAEVLNIMEKVETDEHDKPLVCELLSSLIILPILLLLIAVGGYHY